MMSVTVDVYFFDESDVSGHKGHKTRFSLYISNHLMSFSVIVLSSSLK